MANRLKMADQINAKDKLFLEIHKKESEIQEALSNAQKNKLKVISEQKTILEKKRPELEQNLMKEMSEKKQQLLEQVNQEIEKLDTEWEKFYSQIETSFENKKQNVKEFIKTRILSVN